MTPHTLKAFLAILLLSTTLTFCNSSDIFKEMITLSTPMETQEQQTLPNADCQMAALLNCPRERIAFNRAWYYTDDKELLAAKFALLEECASKAPCAHGFKKPVRSF